jgi:hypothetical protein
MKSHGLLDYTASEDLLLSTDDGNKLLKMQGDKMRRNYRRCWVNNLKNCIHLRCQ